VPAVAFVPHPPALVPELCGGPVAELADVRAACTAAVDRLLATAPEVVWIIGTGPTEHWYGAGDIGSLAPFGRLVTVQLSGPRGPDAAPLPLSLTVGAWLLDQAGYAGERLALSVPADAGDEELRDLAEDIRSRGGLLVSGDGSAMRDADAPGTYHPAAGPFDDTVAAALSAGDPSALAALDRRLGAEVQAPGVAAWRLAGHCLRDVRVSADLLYYAAPFGVGYAVATWLPLP
jgi:hypothetical protein